MTDEVLKDTIWETTRRFWRRRPDGFTVNEKEDIIYVLEFKRVSDTGERYVSETQKLVEIQHLTVNGRSQKERQKTVQGHKELHVSEHFCQRHF
jgi:hypothetical protein